MTPKSVDVNSGWFGRVIERFRGIYRGRNKAVAFGDLVFTVATASDTTQDMAGQTQQALSTIEENLCQAASDKQSIVSANVYIADINQKAIMDDVWRAWIGEDPNHWPQRACLGVSLEGDVLVEITVIAARRQPDGGKLQ